MKNMYKLPEIVKLLEQSCLTHEQKMQAVEALHAARSFGIDEAILMLKGEKEEK